MGGEARVPEKNAKQSQEKDEQEASPVSHTQQKQSLAAISAQQNMKFLPLSAVL